MYFHGGLYIAGVAVKVNDKPGGSLCFVLFLFVFVGGGGNYKIEMVCFILRA